mmetsp:Transcript_106848/g.255060  ORF Transcript_106848/g.255060 Transcript_106848/m.255060 type:complete len:157 (-) Transcript_106848:1368-1838(-)
MSEFTTVVRRWAMETLVRLRPMVRSSESRVAWTIRSDSLSRAEVASSSSSTFGFLASARAMATRWRWPPDKVPPAAPMLVSRPSGRADSVSKIWAMRAASMASSSLISAPALMFSMALVAKSTGCWPTYPSFWRQLRTGQERKGRPFTMISPWIGS